MSEICFRRFIVSHGADANGSQTFLCSPVCPESGSGGKKGTGEHPNRRCRGINESRAITSLWGLPGISALKRLL